MYHLIHITVALDCNTIHYNFAVAYWLIMPRPIVWGHYAMSTLVCLSVPYLTLSWERKGVASWKLNDWMNEWLSYFCPHLIRCRTTRFGVVAHTVFSGGQPTPQHCTNASRGLSAIAEFLVIFLSLAYSSDSWTDFDTWLKGGIPEGCDFWVIKWTRSSADADKSPRRV